VAITDDQARNVQQYEYDSFGNQHDMKTRIKQPYGYTGREHDRETGLRYFRARYYDGEVGRFISEDPIGFAGGDVNLYGYVRNSPIALIDPFGLDWREYVKRFVLPSAGALNPDFIVSPLADIALSKETFATGVLLAVKDYNQELALNDNYDFIDPTWTAQNPYKALEELVNRLNSCKVVK
jgi:RHS repeat-associated protein